MGCFGSIFLGVMICLIPALNRLYVLAAQFLVEFVDPLDELWRRFGRCLRFGFGLNLGFGL